MIKEWPNSYEEYMKLKMQGKDPFPRGINNNHILRWADKNKEWLFKNNMMTIKGGRIELSFQRFSTDMSWNSKASNNIVNYKLFGNDT